MTTDTPVNGDAVPLVTRSSGGPGPRGPHRDGRPARWHAMVAGVVGAGLALGMAELAAGVLSGMPSLLDAVAGALIQVLPGDLLTWGIETFGEADRAVIAGSIAAVVLLVGAGAGTARRADSGMDTALFAGFALLGGALALRDINSSLPVVVVVTVIAAVVGWFAMTWLLRSTTTTAERASGARAAGPGGEGSEPTASPGAAPGGFDRRAFLAKASVVGGAAALTAAGGRRWGSTGFGASGGGASVAAGSSVTLPQPADPLAEVGTATSFDVDGLTPLFVPNEDFYRIDTAVTGPPVVAADDWSMRVHGLVRNELEFTLSDLLDRDLFEADITIACVSNEVGGGLVGNARWLGVRLDDVLSEAGVLPEGTQVVGRAVDGFTVGFPTDVAMDGREAMIAVGMNGEPLPVEHGFPARLVVPGLYGYVSATKWLSDIELVRWDDFDAYWVPRGWSKTGPIKTQSRIDTVVDNPDGSGVVAAGVAWAQPRGVQRVEVRVDDGDFVEAELAEAISDVTWVQWRAPLDVSQGSHQLTVRATDEDGVTQPQQPTPPHPDGAEGWHSMTFRA